MNTPPITQHDIKRSTNATSSPITTLPEELLLSIFHHLDSPPPSQLKSRLEPSLSLTTNLFTPAHQSLKSLSRVSRSWRRIILPLLFRFSCVRLDGDVRDEWSECPACGDQPNHTTRKTIGLDDDHAALFSSAYEDLNNDNDPPTTPSRGPPFTLNTLTWASRIHHSTASYLTFIRTHDLAPSIQSFALLTSRMIEESQSRFPHRMAATSDYRYRAAADLWKNLFDVIPTLRRVVIVAPPADLACLTNCAIDLFGDWAFEDMGLHVLDLRVDGSSSSSSGFSSTFVSTSSAGEGQSPSEVDTRTRPTLPFVPTEYPGIAASSVLKIRPWSHLSLNEGSFLRAYGTYEYFERGPPSLIYSIKDCLASNRRAWRPHSQSGMDLSSLKSFTYTAILPFANHCDFRGLLPYIDELDIKLAPDPSSNILNDKARVGKAELEDCWNEFFDAYRAITRPFRTFEIRKDGTPKLKKFICRDVTTRALVEDLDETFVPLCLPVWAEMEPGVFLRQQAGPPEHSTDLM